MLKTIAIIKLIPKGPKAIKLEVNTFSQVKAIPT